MTQAYYPGIDSQGICANCGANDGLHHYETNQCPRNGIEETRDGKKQEWQNTIFINQEYQRLSDAAPELLAACKEVLSKYQDPYSSKLSTMLANVIKKAEGNQ